jgi:hypothetical protein
VRRHGDAPSGRGAKAHPSAGQTAGPGELAAEPPLLSPLIPLRQPYTSLVDAIAKLAAQNGVWSLYHGLGLAYFTSVVKNSVFFTCYEGLKGAQSSPSPGRLMAYGVLAGMTTTVFLLPLQVIQTLQNVHSNRGARLSTGEAMREVLRERGVAGLFAGLTPSLILSVYPALQHLIFDRLRRWYLRTREEDSLPPLVAFAFGVVANLTALSLTYPLIYVKVRVQAQKVAKQHHLGAVEMAKRIVDRDGFAGLWQGLQSQMTNACVSNAILFATKEHAQRLAFALLKK